MALAHAPVISLSLFASVLSTLVAQGTLLDAPAAGADMNGMHGATAAAQSLLPLLLNSASSSPLSSSSPASLVQALAAAVARLPAGAARGLLSVVPFGGSLGVSYADMAAALYILYRCGGALERRWGSSYTLSYLLHAGLAAAAATQALLPDYTARLRVLAPPAALSAASAATASSTSSGRAALVAAVARLLATNAGARVFLALFSHNGEGLVRLSGVAALVPLAALVTRYMREVPALRRLAAVPLFRRSTAPRKHRHQHQHQQQQRGEDENNGSSGSDTSSDTSSEDEGEGEEGEEAAGDRYYFTEKTMAVVALLKLVLFPQTLVYEAGGAGRRRVGGGAASSLSSHRSSSSSAGGVSYRDFTIDLSREHMGLLLRVLLCGVGILLGYASTRSDVLARSIGVVGRRVCRPLVNASQALLAVISGPSVVVEHAVPSRAPANNNNNNNINNNNNGARGRGLGHGQVEAAEAAAAAPVGYQPDPEAVAAVQALQLPGATPDAIARALFMAGGSVEGAVQLLLDG